MSDRRIPVSDGCSRSVTVEVGRFRVTSAVFPARGFIPPHVHDRACVGFMLGGSFDLTFPGRPARPCIPGTIHIEPAGETHCNCMGSSGARVVVLQPDARDDGIHDLAALLAPNHFLDPGLIALGRRMEVEVGRPDSLSPLALEAFALEALVRLGRRRERRAPERPSRWLDAAEELLRARFLDRDLTVTAIAAEVGVHPAHLARGFRHHHRCSIGRFTRRLRLEWAAEALRRSDRPIAAIAVEAGFADQSHFTRRFRELMGATPGEWRATSGPAA
jgi:AraC family transcriptional regulator